MLAKKKKTSQIRPSIFVGQNLAVTIRGEFEFLFFLRLKKKKANKSQDGQHSEKPKYRRNFKVLIISSFFGKIPVLQITP